MLKNVFILFFLAFLSGCVSSTTVDSELHAMERLLISSNDKIQLVQFYKENLLNDDSYKLKLVKVYVDLQDVKSAELYSNSFDSYEKAKPEFLYTLAEINYLKHNYIESRNYLHRYQSKNGDKSLYYLLLGKIYAEEKRYIDAIDAFEQSRQQGMLDSDIINNIAVVKMMQNDYEGALTILHKLYLQKPNDARLRSNFILSSIKADRQDIALTILKDIYGDNEAKLLLQKLVSAVPVATKPEVIMDMPSNAVESTSQKLVVARTSYTKKKPFEISEPPVPVSLRSSLINKIKITHESETLITNRSKIYRIQVLASYENISIEFLTYLKKRYRNVYRYNSDSLNRYYVGGFNSIEKANRFLMAVDINGAFIVDSTKKRFVKL